MPDRASRCLLLLTLLMFLLALATNVRPVADFEGIAAQSTTVVSEPMKLGMLVAGTPHGPIVIDGDANFSDTALLEGWSGDGSPENPFIINGLDIDFGGAVGNCIGIHNTRVSFTISNCSLTCATYRMMEGGGAGISLYNVTNGELVNNTCSTNEHGIKLDESESNTVANNTCSNNNLGISLWNSYSNIVANNTCNSNINGIRLYRSDDNTVTNNTCNSNEFEGIDIKYSSSNTITNNSLNGCGFFFTGTLTDCRQLEVTGNSVNTLPLVFLQDQVDDVVSSPAGQVILVGCSQVAVKDQILMNCSVGVLLCHTNLTTLVNNTCSGNDIGIYLYGSDHNTVAKNNCSSNHQGINLSSSNSSTVSDNICNNNSIGIELYQSSHNIVANNACNRNDIGIYLDDSHSNTVVNNTCNNNKIGIRVGLHSETNIVISNTCLGNTQHDISLDESDSNTVANNITSTFGGYIFVVLLLIGLVGITTTAIVVLGPRWGKAYQAWQLEQEKRREAYKAARLAEEKRRAFEKSYKDDIIIPIRYRLVSWFRKRTSIKPVDVDEDLEPDSSEE